ncbi:hypothetical protein MMC17_000489 [Xylographa soralifera]|nr:hypothetical protein [Xylographa soralifera]
MLINEGIAISTRKILLVPYESHHVSTYHEWMKDAEIQEATASEPLSIEEEHAMQLSWRQDPDKLTFIVCLPTSPSTSGSITAGREDNLVRMLGDVNLFLTISDTQDFIIGEIELMVAVKSQQGHGYGRASLLAFLTYVAEHEDGLLEEFERERMVEGVLKLNELTVKIGEKNVRSIGLFESVGFTRVEGGEEDEEGENYFGEIELTMGAGWKGRLGERVEGYRELEYRSINQ